MSLYEKLSVNKTANQDEIKKAYHKLSKVLHPDKGGDPEKFKEIVRASEILSDEQKRKLYDELGIIEGENGGAPEGGNPFSGAAGGFPFPFEISGEMTRSAPLMGSSVSKIIWNFAFAFTVTEPECRKAPTE